MSRGFKRVLLGLLVLLMLFLAGSPVDEFLILVVGHGGFGWLLFPFHVVPAIHWNPMAITSAVICIAVLLVGLHSFMIWLSCSWQAGGGGAIPWRKSWTASLLSLVVLAFIAGTAMVGATHQIAWLSTSPEPWITRDWRTPTSHLAVIFASEINVLRKAKKPLSADVFRHWNNEAVASDMRLVVLKDPEGQPWFVAVGAYDPGNPGWKSCQYLRWTGKEGETYPELGSFSGDQWADLIAAAESRQPLDRFGH